MSSVKDEMTRIIRVQRAAEVGFIARIQDALDELDGPSYRCRRAGAALEAVFWHRLWTVPKPAQLLRISKDAGRCRSHQRIHSNVRPTLSFCGRA